MGEIGYKSNFLAMLGKYSYEIFLLHGAFLIKYNFIIKKPEALEVVFGFWTLLGILMVISMAMSGGLKLAYGK
jgi:membrane-bound acyltransferase YfiQ involved in biofilm formation